MTITQEELRDKLHYDEQNDIFIWKKCKHKKLIGEEAGTINGLYKRYNINSEPYSHNDLKNIYFSKKLKESIDKEEPKIITQKELKEKMEYTKEEILKDIRQYIKWDESKNSFKSVINRAMYCPGDNIKFTKQNLRNPEKAFTTINYHKFTKQELKQAYFSDNFVKKRQDLKVTSPKKGYNFEEKEKYRRDVWGELSKRLNPSTSKILFFPSLEGLEIPIALSLGFKEKNLIAIDRSTEVVTQQQWAKAHPNIKCYGSELSDIRSKLELDGIKLDGANLDLCNNLSMNLIKDIDNFLKDTSVFNSKFYIAITVSNGRESTATTTLANLFVEMFDNSRSSTFTNKRLAVLQAYFSKKYSINKVAEGDYKSGKRTMSWGLLEGITASFRNNYYEWELPKRHYEKYVKLLIDLYKQKRDFIDFIEEYHENMLDSKYSVEDISDFEAELLTAYDIYNNLIACIEKCGIYEDEISIENITNKPFNIFNTEWGESNQHLLCDYIEISKNNFLVNRKQTNNRLYWLVSEYFTDDAMDDYLDYLRNELPVNITKELHLP